MVDTFGTVEGRFRLIELLRAMGVSDRHIALTLRSELGLTVEEAEEALASNGDEGDGANGDE